MTDRRGTVVDRRRLLIAAGALGVAGPVLAQTEPPPSAPGADSVIDLLPNLVTRMSAEVRLNRQGPFRFVVDTGANRTALADDVAARLGLPPGPEVLVHGVTAAEPTPTALVRELEVANQRYDDLVTPVFPRSRLGVDGLLGVDVLGRFRLTFDVLRGQLLLGGSRLGVAMGGDTDTASRLGGGESRLRARHRFGQLTLVNVSADGVPIHAFIDSGAQYSVGNMALFNSVAVRRPSVLEQRWTVPVVGATGRVIQGQLAILDTIRLGSTSIRQLPVVFADLHAFTIWELHDTPALLMGADVLGLFSHVTLDYGRREMRFGRVLPRADRPAPGRR